MALPKRVVQFGALPRDPDRDAVLVDVKHPERSRDEIILSQALIGQLDRFETEQRSAKLLSSKGLTPRSRLLFVGPPGCGKTLCSEVISSDLELPLVYARIDGIVSSYLGETATNLRRVFNYSAQQNGVLFFDEFDALGKRRDDAHEIGELKRVVSSFLQILDSFPKDKIVIAATNFDGILDDALWRRFDDVLYFPRPSLESLQRLLQIRLRGVRKRPIDVIQIAQQMQGFTFADAERVCLDAVKSMYIGDREELTEDLLLVALSEHKSRMRFATGNSDRGMTEHASG